MAASNELPENEELDALYDRFLLRRRVAQVSDAGLRGLLKVASAAKSGLSGQAPTTSASSTDDGGRCNGHHSDEGPQLDQAVFAEIRYNISLLSPACIGIWLALAGDPRQTVCMVQPAQGGQQTSAQTSSKTIGYVHHGLGHFIAIISCQT